jgi:hypothetical protein
MAARRKQFRGGRPMQPRSCPRFGTPCTGAIHAAAHCVGRNLPATMRSVAAPAPESPSRKAHCPGWKYNPTKKPVIVTDVQAEAALGEGWGPFQVGARLPFDSRWAWRFNEF